MLAVAEAFAALPERPRRSILFASVTGEEQGLLGSQHLAAAVAGLLRRQDEIEGLAEAGDEIAGEAGGDLELDLGVRAGEAGERLRQDDGGVVVHHREPDAA